MWHTCSVGAISRVQIKGFQWIFWRHKYVYRWTDRWQTDIQTDGWILGHGENNIPPAQQLHYVGYDNWWGITATILYNGFENYSFKIAATSPRGQWVHEQPNGKDLKKNLQMSVEITFNIDLYKRKTILHLLMICPDGYLSICICIVCKKRIFINWSLNMADMICRQHF